MSTDAKVRIECPDCAAALKVQPGLIGQEVACPRCSTEFVAKATSPARPKTGTASTRPLTRKPDRDDDRDDDDRPRRRRDREQDERDDDDRPRRRPARDDDDGDDGEPRPGRCPGCGSRKSTKVSYTWWGGFLGPALFSMVRCGRCRTQYSRKSGRPIGAAHIGLYTFVGAVIGLAIVAVVYLSANR